MARLWPRLDGMSESQMAGWAERPDDREEEASPEEVEQALRQVTPNEHREPRRIAARHKVRIATYVLLFLGATVVFYLVRLDIFALPDRFLQLAQRIARAAMFVILVLGLGAMVEAYVVSRLDDDVSRYNVGRIVRLAEGLVIAFIVISALFANWYTAAVSLGIVSAIFGFALQTPISSFIGWVYILVKRPYRVGDRIEIGGATGDVIDVGYLDTTLWEFGGPYMSTDHPSGRIIRFPNANVLSEPVYNYSWPLFPYIWNEIYVQLAYGTDIRFVAETMQSVVAKELGDSMKERVDRYCSLLSRTPVGNLQVQSKPVVNFRVNENTWVEGVVRYLVAPRRAGAMKSLLTQRIISALNASPDKVMFPKGDSR
ncbi:MAG TPA: mechanosensitive ion channel family protein [Gemmatimonadaceae bacterium]|nr:mechanosensitive ion channel family protein [Gemmatimonadaceae bacterium]